MVTLDNDDGGGVPLAGAVSGLTRPEEWRGIFSPFSHVVLVANSPNVRIDDLQRRYPPGRTLFVFFNKAYKVLDRRFEGISLLVSRGQPKGANIVYRNEVKDVLSLFDPSSFLGIMNIRLDLEEKLNSSADFAHAPTGHLDLVGYCEDFYQAGKTPTSGFAMAMWLLELKIPGEVVLAGFSAKRSQQWRVVSVHDWTLEQTVLRTMARLGQITLHHGICENPYARIAQRFPQIPPEQIALTAAEVLSERLSNTDGEVDKLISLTNIIRAGDNFLRRLKPQMFKKR